MAQPEFQYLTKSEAKYGHGISIYGWKECTSGVMKGQTLKHFITTVDTEEEALELYPEAQWSNQWIEPQPNFNHL